MTKEKGNYFEDKAVAYLQNGGYLLVELNFYAKKLGEIDIVATKDGVYHFVEVKSGESFEAVYNITPSKLGKLKRSVEYYLQTKKLYSPYCIDAIIFAGEDLEFLENITF